MKTFQTMTKDGVEFSLYTLTLQKLLRGLDQCWNKEIPITEMKN